MIVSVTPNPAVDRILFFEDFVWGRRIQVQRALWGPGGKGTDGACIVAELGYPCLALALAAGQPGERLAELLRSAGATPDFTPAGGSTRVNYVLVDTAHRRQVTLTVDALQVSASQLAAFEDRVVRALDDCTCLWLGGSMPSGVPDDLHARFIRQAHAHGIPTILDARGPALREGAAAHPTVLKPNEYELAELLDQVPADPGALADALVKLLEGGTRLVLATLGERGAVAITHRARWFLPPLDVPVVNAAGAGDGMAAALAIGLSEGWSWEKSLRLAVATAAAVVMTPGTAECHRADVERLLPQVRLEPLA